MEENFSLTNLNDDDVVSFKNKLYKVGQVRETLIKSFDGKIGHQITGKLHIAGIEITKAVSQSNDPDTHGKWFNEGVPLEFLRVQESGWRKGKVRLKVEVEFYSDEPESPLDDIRQQINQE